MNVTRHQAFATISTFNCVFISWVPHAKMFCSIGTLHMEMSKLSACPRQNTSRLGRVSAGISMQPVDGSMGAAVERQCCDGCLAMWMVYEAIPCSSLQDMASNIF